MANFNAVRKALGDAIQTYQRGVRVYFYTPRTVIPPTAIVKAQPHRSIDYIQAQSSGFANWYFDVMLVVGQVDERAAQQQAGDLVSPGSDLIEALNNTVIDTGYAQVTNGYVSDMTFGTGLYAYAQLVVLVRA